MKIHVCYVVLLSALALMQVACDQRPQWIEHDNPISSDGDSDSSISQSNDTDTRLDLLGDTDSQKTHDDTDTQSESDSAPQCECSIVTPCCDGCHFVAGTCDDDGIQCTDDVCDAGDCVHPVKEGNCFIDSTCHEDNDTQVDNLCSVCDPSSSQEDWSHRENGTSCGDDGIACTADTCNAGLCEHPVKENQCYIELECRTSGEQKSGNPCKVCSPTQNDRQWTLGADQTPCDSDGVSCTDDVCMAGECAHPVSDGYCHIGAACITDGVVDDLNSCRYCNTSQTQTDWTDKADQESCSDDNACTLNDVCLSGSCRAGGPKTCESFEVCDATSGNCQNNCSGCVVSNSCLPIGSTRPSNPCERCAGANVWTAKSNGTACIDDGQYCTGDYCMSGTCTHPSTTCAGECDEANNTCCIPNHHLGCSDGAIYWFDSCSNRESIQTDCDENATCVSVGTSVTCECNEGWQGNGLTCSNCVCNTVDDCCDGCYPREGNACNDSVYCNGAETCNAQGTCVSAGDPCTGGNVCNRQCNESTDTCYSTPGTECFDGILCTYADQCDGAGLCVGTPLVCVDDPTTCGANRACDGTAQCQVSYPDNTTSCDDGEPCTYTDKCDAGGNCGGTSIVCEDDTDLCGPSRSCDGSSVCQTSYPGESQSCDDQDPTTESDSCDGAGACSGLAFCDATVCEHWEYIEPTGYGLGQCWLGSQGPSFCSPVGGSLDYDLGCSDYGIEIDTDSGGSSGLPDEAFCGQDAQYPDLYPVGYTASNRYMSLVAGKFIQDNITGLEWRNTLTSNVNPLEAEQHCGTLDIVGRDDWRVPDPHELASLVTYGRGNDSDVPATNFPLLRDACTEPVWTSHSIDAYSHLAVDFCNGSLFALTNNNISNVVCVRKGVESVAPGADPSRFVSLGAALNQTVLDRLTGLEWQVHDGSASGWGEALLQCETLSQSSFDDWRLPSVNELRRLADHNLDDPACDSPSLENTTQRTFWSSSPVVFDDLKAWLVDFTEGIVTSETKTQSHGVLCVRRQPQQ